MELKTDDARMLDRGEYRKITGDLLLLEARAAEAGLIDFVNETGLDPHDLQDRKQICNKMNLAENILNFQEGILNDLEDALFGEEGAIGKKKEHPNTLDVVVRDTLKESLKMMKEKDLSPDYCLNDLSEFMEKVKMSLYENWFG